MRFILIDRHMMHKSSCMIFEILGCSLKFSNANIAMHRLVRNDEKAVYCVRIFNSYVDKF